MASLIKLDEHTFTSETDASVVGIDSTYDVYKVVISGLEANTTSASGYLRVVKDISGTNTVLTSANYDLAQKGFRSDANTFNDLARVNDTYWNYTAFWSSNASTGGVRGNAVINLFQFNDPNEYSFMTMEATTVWANGLLAPTGAGVFTVAEQHIGVNLSLSNATAIDAGKMVLYGYRK